MQQEKSTSGHMNCELNLRQKKIRKLEKNKVEFDTRNSENSFGLR